MDEFKKIILAGIGGASVTYEKMEDTLNKLVVKGRLTVDQGKLLSQELVRKKKEKNSEEELSREDVQELLMAMNVAQRKDIEELEKKVDQLNETIDKLINK
ncbi:MULTISPECIES: phasin family protein [Carnobacterium]|uniref:Phasin family protein n=1 Tax=Carnobacterium antarcticum TaxID=2126436 RepID=A0ABW4NLJ0_9LACT|nr:MULTISPECIES: hypothetical protein [unclassified Carnobacterium]ALV21759.1 no significant [Carnobacterium sp. CP1]QQP69762.1 hypothetical protein JHE06_09125 [Carnobacterium sp. CS13]